MYERGESSLRRGGGGSAYTRPPPEQKISIRGTNTGKGSALYSAGGLKLLGGGYSPEEEKDGDTLLLFCALSLEK